MELSWPKIKKFLIFSKKNHPEKNFLYFFQKNTNLKKFLILSKKTLSTPTLKLF